MKERGLALSPEKTVVTHIAHGFDFLGQNIRKYNGKLLITPSKKSIMSFLRKVRASIKAMNGAPAWKLVQKLTPVIRGWANYHHHVVSSKVFSSVDHAIHQALWRWAKRRHPNKGPAGFAGSTFTPSARRTGYSPGPCRRRVVQRRSISLRPTACASSDMSKFQARSIPTTRVGHRTCLSATGMGRHRGPTCYRVRSNERYQRLEPYDGKLSRTVLRGGGDGNVALLPDKETSR